MPDTEKNKLKERLYLLFRKVIRAKRQVVVDFKETILRVPKYGSYLSEFYYNLYLKKKIHEVNAYLTTEGNKYASFIFFTDTHWGANEKKSPYIIECIQKGTGINKVIFGGDFITDSDSDKSRMIALGHSFMKNMSDHLAKEMFCVLGNHDDNSYEQDRQASILSDKEITKTPMPAHLAPP